MENEMTIKNVCSIKATLSRSNRHVIDEHGNHLAIDDVISIVIPQIEDVEMFEGDMVLAMSIPQAKALMCQLCNLIHSPEKAIPHPDAWMLDKKEETL